MKWKNKLLLLLCVLSGMASLIYQALWIRVLSLGVGSTSAAISMVLSIFFFGLALGSFWCGRWVQRFRSPLRVYGLVEGAIGIYGAVVIYVLVHFHQLMRLLPASDALSTFSGLSLLVKGVLVFFLLIVPCLGMGASLPLLVRALIQREKHADRSLGLLYGLNTLGAVFGAFVTGFVLIPYFGVIWSNHIAVMINLAVFGLAFLLSRRPEEAQFVLPPSVEPIAVTRNGVSRPFLLFAAGICGFSSIAAEVVWSKYLSIFMGSNIFGLGLILSLYLLGIAVGSLYLAARIDRWPRLEDRESLLTKLLVVSVIATWLATYLLNLAPLLAGITAYYVGGAVPLLFIKSVWVALILFIPTSIYGAIFPLLVSCVTRSSEDSPRALSQAYAINTLGSILGSCLTGLVFIPWVGSGNSLKIALVVLALLPFFMVLKRNPGLVSQPKRRRTRLVYATLGLFIGLGVIIGKNVDFRNIIKSAYFQAADDQMTFAEAVRFYARDYEEFRLIIEGQTGIISLSHDPQDGPNYRDYFRLKTNGLNESVYNLKNMTELPKYEALLGFLPYAFTRDPKRAFVVGFGGGFTVDFLTSTDLERVQVAELESGIIEAAKTAYQGSNPILSRKSLALQIQDARFVLSSKQTQPFDIIVSQPSHSWLSGVANLFTQEFFETVRGNLSSKGIFSQWLNLYNMDPVLLKSILRTFYTVFPHGAVFTNPGDQEMIMLGSVAPLHANLAKLDSMAKNPRFAEQLAQIPFESGFDLLSSYSLGRSDVMRVTEGSKLNTDVNAYAEVGQTRLFYASDRNAQGPQGYLSSVFTGDYSDLLPELNIPTTKSETVYAFYEGLLTSLKRLGKYNRMLVVLAQWERLAAEDPSMWERLANWTYQVERYGSAEQYLKQAASVSGGKFSISQLRLALSAKMGSRDYAGVESLARAYPQFGDAIVECYRADAFELGGKISDADQLLNRMIRDEKRYRAQCGPFFEKILGKYLVRKGRFAEAIAPLVTYYNYQWNDLSVMRALSVAYLQTGDLEKGVQFVQYLEKSTEQEGNRLRSLAASFRAGGWDGDAAALGYDTPDVDASVHEAERTTD